VGSSPSAGSFSETSFYLGKSKLIVIKVIAQQSAQSRITSQPIVNYSSTDLTLKPRIPPRNALDSDFDERFEIARVFVRLDHVVSFVVNANHDMDVNGCETFRS
jgi:hypothetical protein